MRLIKPVIQVSVNRVVPKDAAIRLAKAILIRHTTSKDVPICINQLKKK